jgi:hypothetical protein
VHKLVWQCDTCTEHHDGPTTIFEARPLHDLSISAGSYTGTQTPSRLPLSVYLREPTLLPKDRGGPLGEVLQRWYNIVSEYGARALTVLNDKLPAIAGVAQEITN